MIKDGLKLVMTGTEEDVIRFIDKSRDEFKKMSPEEIAFPRTVSDVVKHKSHSTIYAKGTPIHVRGLFSIITMSRTRNSQINIL